MFKKILFGMSALALATACTDDYTDWAAPQTNPAVPAWNIECNIVAAQTETIELDNITAETVKVIDVTLPEGITADGYNVKLMADGANYADYNVAADADGFVKTADLQKAATEMFTKESVERVFKAVASTSVNVTAQTGTVAVQVVSDTLTIAIKPITPQFNPYIYEIGNSQGWSVSTPLYSENGDGIYQGYYYLDGGYKFKPNADNWDGDWGQDPNGAPGSLIQEGEENCTADAGFYQIDVDLVNMTYNTTAVTAISIIGTVNGNWDTDTDLTYNTATGAWETTADLSAGAMKFRMNHDWAISWGGANSDPTAFGNLTQHNGKDLDLTEAGTYFIQLFITYEGNNRVVVTKM